MSEQLKQKCLSTQTSVEGMQMLLDYYQKSLGWSEERANEYALSLFEDGTIEQIKVIGGEENAKN